MREVSVGMGLFVEENVTGCRVWSEYIGERIQMEEDDFRAGMYPLMGISYEYLTHMDGTDIVIDGIYYGGYAKFANHSCSPNAQYIIHRLPDSPVDVVFIHATRDIPAGDEVFLDYGWSISGPKKSVICECGAAVYKGYI